MKTTIATVLALLLLALPVLAQDGGGGEEEFDIEAALKRVGELLKQTETLLVESLKERSETEGAATAGAEARKALEELLKDSRQSGRDAADGMTEIVEKAPRKSGGGQGQEQHEPKPGEDQKRKEEEKELGNRDPQNSEKSGQPETPRESKGEPGKDSTKLPSQSEESAKPDPDQDWLAKLPPRVRDSYLNKDWGKIPPKWRAWIEAYVKRLAEKESAGGGD